MSKNIQIIGSGFSSLSAACYLAKAGHQVSIYEKNSTVGGRARQLNKNGFTFDIGPSWYWMPDIFDRFFSDFGKKTSDYYQIDKLDPAYKIFFDIHDNISFVTSMTVRPYDDDIVDYFDTLDSIISTTSHTLIAIGKKVMQFSSNNFKSQISLYPSISELLKEI